MHALGRHIGFGHDNEGVAQFPGLLALLRKLPDLPPELEYRIVGRSLLLRDVKANLIVDILRDVVPTIPS